MTVPKPKLKEVSSKSKSKSKWPAPATRRSRFLDTFSMCSLLAVLAYYVRLLPLPTGVPGVGGTEVEVESAGEVSRFYSCDPKCVLEKCSDDDDDLVCVRIVEVDPDGYFVDFPSTCAFNCANRCYENQLDILRKGSCKVDPKDNEIPHGKPPPLPIGDDEDE